MDSNQLRTLQKKRTANFREDETKLLIQLWGSPSIQNKLFLTHRKAPVMRLLAANMQQRGFYRTPDEIKTRIRNLKCLYHRIKRTMSCGTGIGTVDPDWPHFKAMDEILSKEYPRKLTDRILEEQRDTPKFEDVQIKQEIDDIDNDDTWATNDSWATNESVNSEYEEDSQQSAGSPMPPVTIKPFTQPIPLGTIQVKKTSTLQAHPTQQVQILPIAGNSQMKPHIPIQPAPKAPQSNLATIQIPSGQVAQNGGPPKATIPFPLLILNNLNGDKNATNRPHTITSAIHTDPVVTTLLKDLLALQKTTLDVHKQKLAIEKQRLEFDRLISTQMVTMLPMMGGLLQRLAYPGNQDLIDLKFDVVTGFKRKRSPSDDAEILSDSKILRNMLEKGMRKYMSMDDVEKTETEEVITDESSDKDDNVKNNDKMKQANDVEQADDDDDDDDDGHLVIETTTRRTTRSTN